MSEYEVGDKLYYVNANDNLVSGIIELVDDEFIWVRFGTDGGETRNVSIRREDNPWPVFPTSLEAIGYARNSVAHEIDDLVDELALAHVKKARLESLYSELVGEKL